MPPIMGPLWIAAIILICVWAFFVPYLLRKETDDVEV